LISNIQICAKEKMKSSKKSSNTKKVEEKKEEFLIAPWEEIHGFKGSEKWQAPKLAVYCDEDARPGYNTKKAHEYLDSDEVFQEKIKLLAEMIKKSENMIAYTGAGISTASGIGDYATKAGSKSVANRPKLKSPLLAEPTFAHRALAKIYEAGHLKMWIQQNHDGLPQKAGLPQQAINEIHGAWFDPSNPVVPMSGDLRDDLFKNLLKWEEKTDLCLAMGTSLSGMNADRVVETVGTKALNGEAGAIGAVIVSVQQTRLDGVAALRIFAMIDRVMSALACELGIDVPDSGKYEPKVPEENKVEDHVVQIAFDNKGKPTRHGQTTSLDLRPGKFVKITGGSYKGDFGVVQGMYGGHYAIRFAHIDQETGGCEVDCRLFGNWWLEAGVKGHGVVPGGLFPLVSVAENVVPEAIRISLLENDN
jgi:NAD-dependent SIR2 family protein deacetylase